MIILTIIPSLESTKYIVMNNNKNVLMRGNIYTDKNVKINNN